MISSAPWRRLSKPLPIECCWVIGETLPRVKWLNCSTIQLPPCIDCIKLGKLSYLYLVVSVAFGGRKPSVYFGIGRFDSVGSCHSSIDWSGSSLKDTTLSEKVLPRIPRRNKENFPRYLRFGISKITSKMESF